MRTPLQFAAVNLHSIWPLGLIGVLVVSVSHVSGHGDPAARIFTDPAHDALVIDLAPMDLPANTPHHAIAQPPVATLEIPVTGYIYGFRAEVVDSAGRVLPDELIHHFNLIDPDHRELFLPISDRKSTRLNSSHGYISYAVFCLKKKKKKKYSI